jgi:hypothetical protein
MDDFLKSLENSNEPAVRFLYQTQILGRGTEEPAVLKIREEVKNSERVQKLLAETTGLHPYQKWRGAHWVLSLLAELGYPQGDKDLIPLREAELGWLLDEDRLKSIPFTEGRYRRCASQEGNAVYSLVKLGLADERVNRLVKLLLGWQWPDSGWNCDKKPEAHVSSFNESLIPLRGLAAYWNIQQDQEVKAAIDRASEFFLQRQLFRRLTNHTIIRSSFTQLSYPHYWHYDILFGLKVMFEAGKLSDPRCNEALDLLKSKQLANGGFRAEGKYYRLADKVTTGVSSVDWGPVSTNKSNEFISVQALSVLKQAGR